MHFVHEPKAMDGCTLRVLFDSSAMERLVLTGHGTCLLDALAKAQLLVAELVGQVETAITCTITRKPC